MKIIKKIGVFLVVAVLLCSIFAIPVYAEAEPQDTYEPEASEDDGKLDMGLKPESFSERLEYAIQGTVTGLVMVFAVLTLLCIILYISKYVFYDIPNKKKLNSDDKKPAEETVAPVVTEVQTADTSDASDDDGELAAVITAAVAAMLEGEEYKNEFAGGFRVVSFKRSTKSAWNRK